MKLHKILKRHCAPKDCSEDTVGYVIADNEEQVLKYVDKELNSDMWTDKHTDDTFYANEYEIYNAEYEVIGTETYMERMLRLRGEFNDEDADYEDAYYGVTHYGWDEGVDIGNAYTEAVVCLGIAKDLRNV